MSTIEQIEQGNECPICYEEIENNINCVTTECGHKFHCSCLMRNSSVNGFTCPMCRGIMAEVEEDEEDEDEDEENEIISDDALTSFRMFHQQLDGEEVEEEVVEEEEEEEEGIEGIIVKPTAEHIASELIERGFIMEDLVKSLLIEHAEYDEEGEYDRNAEQIFGAVRSIISRYQRDN
jgi:hypothetical protein